MRPVCRVDALRCATPDMQATTPSTPTIAGQATEMTIGGMTCASCLSHVEHALAAVPRVASVSVNLATERASVRHADGVTLEQLVDAVRAAGYDAAPVASGLGRERHASRREAQAADQAASRRSLGVAVVLTTPLFVIEMLGHAIPEFHHWLVMTLGAGLLAWSSAVLASIVMLGPGRRILVSGARALVRRRPDMNSLVALGTSSAYAYSLISTALPSILPTGTANVYFEASAVVITLVLLGDQLEARSKARSSGAIEQLLDLQPRLAQVVRNGEIVELPTAEVVVGDLVMVRPGQTVPVDGDVVDGSSHVDESMITGESTPVHKLPGASVTGGTRNGLGAFEFRATHTGDATTLARIVRMVDDAQASKLPIQRYVDQITRYFVPVVIGLAVLTFVGWWWFGPAPAVSVALVNAVAVLIIACPCAMGLATPMSILVGTGRAAQLGVLFRRGDALQTLAGTSVVAFDKTGTLTVGRPTLTDLVPIGALEPGQLLAYAAALEARSEHPIAAAIVAAAQARTLPDLRADSFEAVPGFGVRGLVAGRCVELGSARYMVELGYALGPAQASSDRLSAAAKTVVWVAVEGRVEGILAVADPLRPDARVTIDALRRRGYAIALITGDHPKTGEAVARSLGVDYVVAGALPDAKVAALRSLRAGGRLRTGGRRVVFVGDGINDAPVLAEADVGIAVGTGTDIAIENADVVTMAGNLSGVVTAIDLSRVTMTNIRQNLGWAFGYNVILIPLAAGLAYPAFGLLLSPAIAGAAMAASSLFVLANALRLRRFSPTQHARAL